MSVDHDAVSEREQVDEPVSTATMIAYAVFGVFLTSWFLFIWLVVQKGFIDSVGEVAGIGFAMLLLVAIVGSVRRNLR